MASITYELSVRKGPEEGQVFPLAAATIILGRDPMSDIVLTDPEVSRQHARLLRTESGYSIQDLGSTNGTFVDGRRLKGDPLSLSPGDVITMGSNVTMLYELAAGEELVLPDAGGDLVAREPDSLAAKPAELAPPAVTERLAETGEVSEGPGEGEAEYVGAPSDITGPITRMEEDTGALPGDVPPASAQEELPSLPRAERRRREPPPPPYEPAARDVADAALLPDDRRPNHRNRNIMIALVVLLLLCCCCFLLTGYYVWGDPLYDFIRFYFIG